MKRLCAALGLWAWLASAALAQTSVFVPATQVSIPLSVAAGTVAIVTNPGAAGNQPAKSIYITAVDFIAAGATTVQFIAGTGATCGTGTVSITGNYTLAAGQGLAKGDGNGAVWVVPPGFNFCAVVTGVTLPGSLGYAVF